MIDSQSLRIQKLGFKILSLMFDPYRLQFTNHLPIQFENYTKNINTTLKGIEFFLKVLRESYRVIAHRLAAKGLLNLSIKSRETKLSIVFLLEEEIQRLQMGEMNTVVQGYFILCNIQNNYNLRTKERGQLL
ncbi:unnamed protein product [Paramecium octaurelia]|uniref:Uncharacterized protein n=1 Tax=Paramecium octaurelia TaxID=43137 RepID=A0A8S1W4X3_PAROT|nr:unnamed protein product [Paramecium octaurelia]